MKRFGFSLIALCLAGYTHGQIWNRMLSSEQEFLRMVTDSAVVMVRQDYILQTTDSVKPQEFGRGGREWFGRTITLGVLIDGYLTMPEAILKPWRSDPFFAPYDTIDTLKPVATTLAYKLFGQSDYTILTRRADTLPVQDSARTVSVKFDASCSISADYQTTDTTGWLVLAYAGSDSGHVNFKRFRAKWQNAASGTIRPPDDASSLLGGIYFTMKFTTGLMRVTAAGFVVKKPFNWVIEKAEPPFIPSRGESKPVKAPEPINLTPVQQKNE